MSKAIMFTDVHITPIRGMELFVDTSLKCMNKVMDYAEEQNIKRLFCLGDSFHSKSMIENYLLVKAKPTFERFKEFDTTFIVGNHDLVFQKNSKYNLLELFDEYIEVVQDPYITKEIDGNNFILCNYAGNDHIKEETLPIIDGVKNVLLGHFDCNGFYTNADYEMKNAEINVENLRMFDAVFVGHYHKRSKRRNVQFIGSTHQQRKNDIGNPTGFTVLDTKSLMYTFKDFEGYTPPCFYNLSISDIDEIKKIKNSFIEIVITEDEANIISNDMINQLKRFLYEKNNNYLVTPCYVKNKEQIEVSDDAKMEKEITEIDRINLNAKLEDMFDTYVENVETKLDRDKLKHVIKN